MLARSNTEMCLGFPTTPAVTVKNWKSWSQMHQLVMCLAHAVDNEDANAVFREWRAYLSSPAAAPGSNSSQAAMGASQNPHSIEPANLHWQFPKTYFECIVIPNSKWLNILDKDQKTADEQVRWMRFGIPSPLSSILAF